MLVDGAPQPVFLAADHHDHLVQMLPHIVSARRFARLVKNDDTTLQQTQAQRKSKTQPDCVANDGRRITMTLVTGGGLDHDGRILARSFITS